jgi:hypothetical protein
VERRPNTQLVQWFLENAASGSLVLDPPFQRRTIWSLSYRRYFIDTVLRNYPSPAVFLQLDIEPGGPTKYNVVDGKQRLTTIIDFVRDKFGLGDLLEDLGYSSNPYWSDLSETLQRKFVNYVLTVENINDASDTERREAFDRLNRNVARLAPQELRHAQFPGVLLDRMEALAIDPFWMKHRIVTPANIRRMRDVEFVSEIFLLTMHGVLDGDAEVLDQYFADYDEEIPDEDIHRERYDAVLEYIGDLPLEIAQTRWKNMNDFYGIWGALCHLKEEGELPDPDQTAERLAAFDEVQSEILAYDSERHEATVTDGDDRPGNDEEQRYFTLVRQGANKRPSRRARVEILTEALGS